ncbi:MAG: AmmeMemoRadiSam system protein B [Phycisphaerales bacterium]|jgi:AmmeMemoRadiSam system protein B|nr:AmmeMemoRadiSam system protein B [Phycisphaerales bacterium]
MEPMAGPVAKNVRQPAVAGLFYPADPVVCREVAKSYLRADETNRPVRWIGGLVPHAGWKYSGAIAGRTIATMAAADDVDVVVVFGAIHNQLDTDSAVLDVNARWRVPGGESELPGDIQRKLIKDQDLFVVDERFHRTEHAVEVELPLIQQAWPKAKLLPLEIPVIEQAAEMGRLTAKCLINARYRPVFLASSDLTHYGPAYGFAPAGVGRQGLDWARENDRRLLELLMDRSAERVVSHVRQHHNACGGGAIAAMLAACDELGSSQSRLLCHANSHEVWADAANRPPTDAVGYAAMVIG